MVKACLDQLEVDKPKRHFTIGIHDDVTHTSPEWDTDFDIEPDDVVRAVFYGLGSDGTVGANKNSIKIIGENTDNHAQGYFVYDSKKAGAVTISHLRFGPRAHPLDLPDPQRQLRGCPPFRLPGSAGRAGSGEARGRIFLLNAPYRRRRGLGQPAPGRPADVIIEKKLRFYVIDAAAVATGRPAWDGASTRSCRPASSPWPGCMPRDEAILQIKRGHRQDLSATKGQGGRPEELRGGGRSALEHLQEVERPRGGDLPGTSDHPRYRSTPRTSCRTGNGADHRRRGRPAAGKRLPGGRHLACGNVQMGEAQHRPGDPRLG